MQQTAQTLQPAGVGFVALKRRLGWLPVSQRFALHLRGKQQQWAQFGNHRLQRWQAWHQRIAALAQAGQTVNWSQVLMLFYEPPHALVATAPQRQVVVHNNELVRYLPPDRRDTHLHLHHQTLYQQWQVQRERPVTVQRLMQGNTTAMRQELAPERWGQQLSHWQSVVEHKPVVYQEFLAEHTASLHTIQHHAQLEVSPPVYTAETFSVTSAPVAIESVVDRLFDQAQQHQVTQLRQAGQIPSSGSSGVTMSDPLITTVSPVQPVYMPETLSPAQSPMPVSTVTTEAPPFTKAPPAANSTTPLSLSSVEIGQIAERVARVMQRRERLERERGGKY
ncbi:MAG: hypothetical protein WAQ53_03565 [Thiofilum sp.]|uniref:hypothetical protein n=1 Tax=Thiofilum sp. TaxID=2212733 RepID=UPI0025F524A8|nr:hypothetical protein [Thiofilum sp.]MBK8454768.1 hypothetical protein [Thiofilum sp.]